MKPMTAQKLTSSLPAKKPRATAPKSRPAANLFRSAEFVEDSDVSEGAETEALRKKNEKKEESRITTSASVTSKPAPTKGKTSTPKPSDRRSFPSSESSKEISSESSDRSGSEASSSSQEGSLSSTRPKQKPARSFQPQSSHEPSVEKVQLSKSKTNVKSSTQEIFSQSEREGGSESSESESESESGSSDQTSLHSPRKRSPIQKPTSKQPAVYDPPSGFEASSIAIHPSSKAAALFSPTNLEGKEIWHIMAPASVPISAIKEVPTQSVQSRTSIMFYKGADYCLVPETGAEAPSNRALLLPSTQTNDYRISASKITKTLHLQQLMNLPIQTISSAKSPSQAGPAPELLRQAPRQQPEGLRMRYHPFGVSDDSDSETLPENAVKAPHFRVPDPVETSPARKRKRAEKDTAIEIMDISPAESKSKKPKNHSDAAVNGTGTAMDVDAIENAAPVQSQSMHDIHKTPDGTSSAAASLNGVRPGIAEAKRKQGKHKHKQLELPSAPISALPSAITNEAETIMPEEVVVDGASAIDTTHSEAKKSRRREAEAKLLGPEQSSPQQLHGVVNGGLGSTQASHQTSPSRESKEERAKREEKKRKRKRKKKVRIATGSS
ncbi:hypothetical protein N7G274_007688 [Stereocaulon virgatum]|uniref:Uncharacterized protein n=1 Tax=Stereocaulon virgatum TaxID=373712 RepID=A0ABR4A2A2_9LECA